MAGQMIRQKCVASATAAAARMREKDDGANSNRFRWTPHVTREDAVAGGIERLHAPLVNSESAWDKWVVCHAVNDTSFPNINNAVTCASRKGVSHYRTQTENKQGAMSGPTLLSNRPS